MESADPARTTADRYRRFAEWEAPGVSETYGELAGGVAADPELIALLDGLPSAKRQPNLLFGAVRFLDGPVRDYAAFRAWTRRHWDRIRAVMLERRTQTNEPGRCATLLPLLATLPEPLALIEVGASAGLCLYPDRYAYSYDGRPPIGPDGAVVLGCATTGPVPLPARPPAVAWRAGIDLNPLDVRDPDAVRWLDSLIWPEHEHRRERLRAAVRIAAADPPHLVRGDLNRALADLVARVPDGATPVIFHSAVLPYMAPADRERFAGTVRDLPGHWVANEAPEVLPEIGRAAPPPPAHEAVFVLALDGRPVAFTGPHGRSLRWFG
ncbi:MAG: DUF2332 family protein [Streptosporangiales bacterium]|nr:DUF2332 family protein [Streptosporangiales bacterium]